MRNIVISVLTLKKIIAVLMASITGTLRIVSSTAFFANRTAQNNGDSVTLYYTAGHVGDDTNDYTTPSVMWLKNGAPARTTPINTVVSSNGQLTSTLSFSFQESDAGVYQCIFITTSIEIYGATPLRLDAGISILIVKK